MVIGNQHLNARAPGGGHAVNGRNTVVHGDQQIGGEAARAGQIDDFRAETVAELKAIGHQVAHFGRAQRAQHGHTQRGAGGAVGVEVAHEKNALTPLQSLCQAPRGRIDTFQGPGRMQRAQTEIQLARGFDTARRVQSGQQRMTARESRRRGRVATPNPGRLRHPGAPP